MDSSRIDFVSLTDYRGQTRRVDFNGDSSLIYGPNGSGKSSVLRAISLALTGRLPGDSSDLDTKGYIEETGPSGAFKIEVGFSDGGRVVREFTGTQMRVRVNFGDNPTSPRNTDHEQALVERCGRNVGLFMDANRIVALSPDNLRNMVLRMCAESGGSQQWTARMITDYLYGEVSGLKGLDLLEPLVQRYAENGDFEPLVFMDSIQNTLEKAATECRRSVREFNQTLNAKAPIERPDPDKIQEFKGFVAENEGKLSALQRNIGAVQEKIASIRAANAEIKANGDRSAKYIKQAEDAAKNANTAVSRYESTLDDLNNDLNRIKSEKPQPPVLQESVDDLFSQSGDQADDAPKYDGDLNADKARLSELDRSSRQMAERQRAAGTAVGNIEGRLWSVQAQLKAIADGKCPTCGQMTDGVRDSLHAEITRLSDELTVAKAEQESANDAQVRAIDEFTSLDTKIAAHERAIVAYNAAKEQRERSKPDPMADYSAAIKRWDSMIAGKLAEIESIKSSLTRFQAMRDEADAILAEAVKARSGGQPDFQTIPAELQKQADEYLEEEARLVAFLDSDRAILEEMNGDVKTLDEFNRRQHEAELGKQAAQNELSLLTDGLALLPKLLTLIVDSLVGPLVMAVNATLPPRIGVFSVRFNPTFSIGIERPNADSEHPHYIPMSALSTAEKYIFLASIQRAMVEMSGASVPVAPLDNIEVMDHRSWASFQSFVNESRDSMQIILSGRRDDNPESELAFGYKSLYK